MCVEGKKLHKYLFIHLIATKYVSPTLFNGNLDASQITLETVNHFINFKDAIRHLTLWLAPEKSHISRAESAGLVIEINQPI